MAAKSVTSNYCDGIIRSTLKTLGIKMQTAVFAELCFCRNLDAMEPCLALITLPLISCKLRTKYTHLTL